MGMADEEQLATLRQGPEAWNVWRQNHPDIRPDLSGAKPKLSGANLRGSRLGCMGSSALKGGGGTSKLRRQIWTCSVAVLGSRLSLVEALQATVMALVPPPVGGCDSHMRSMRSSAIHKVRIARFKTEVKAWSNSIPSARRRSPQRRA